MGGAGRREGEVDCSVVARVAREWEDGWTRLLARKHALAILSGPGVPEVSGDEGQLQGRKLPLGSEGE